MAARHRLRLGELVAEQSPQAVETVIERSNRAMVPR